MMGRLLCFIFGHKQPAKGQHIAYRGERYQWRCNRCGDLKTRSWSSHYAD